MDGAKELAVDVQPSRSRRLLSGTRAPRGAPLRPLANYLRDYAVVPEPSSEDTRSPAKASSSPSGAAGISQFLSRVLEQLSLSAWFPAAVLIGSYAILDQLRRSGRADIGSALSKLASHPLSLLIAALFSLILTAVVIQAFEFEIIRLLEGYADSSFAPLNWLLSTRIRRWRRRLEKLSNKAEQIGRDNFSYARLKMLSPNGPYLTWQLAVIESEEFGTDLPCRVSARKKRAALDIDWQAYVEPDKLHYLQAIESQISHYPAGHRILPTRLGNTLRSTEDRLTLGEDEDIPGYVYRHHERLPNLLREDHRSYRTRLDMYCSLVLVFIVLIFLSAVMLKGVHPEWALSAVSGSYLILAFVSYEAAIASARGYGDVLLEIDRYAAQEVASETRRRWLRLSH